MPEITLHIRNLKPSGLASDWVPNDVSPVIHMAMLIGINPSNAPNTM
ncbi:MAG: hypothetical protein GKR95_06875 [Gammaproteobacteria bacterium]|nr:hypothetical protein [Gammaproteobacteria bacterium]